jgi:hypothetical protein
MDLKKNTGGENPRPAEKFAGIGSSFSKVL